ncbi:MAG: HEAT repeat domain-containing protein [Edaphobacter sp.]
MSTSTRGLRFSKAAPLLIALLLLPLHHLQAQRTSTGAEDQSPDSKIVTTTAQPQRQTQEDQATQLPPRDRTHNTVAQNSDEAWSMLSTAVADTKHADLRTQALAALGTLGANPHGERMIAAAMKDPDVDVRTAAILAAGQTKSRNLTTDIRNLLDDKEPQVAFVAATTLWKMNDRSGEDILVAVVNGDRSANPGVVNGTMHKVNKDLHHPATLARIGVLQGAALLLGPFGFGVSAIEYMRKNGGDEARVSAIEQLSQEKTAPIRNELIAALTDKDPAVRAAAAKALGSYRKRSISDALLPVFDDEKAPVRLTAAAAYIRATHATPSRNAKRGAISRR